MIYYYNVVTIDVTTSSKLSTSGIHVLRYMIDTLISVHALFISIRKKVHSTLARMHWNDTLTKRFNLRRNLHCCGESVRLNSTTWEKRIVLLYKIYRLQDKFVIIYFRKYILAWVNLKMINLFLIIRFSCDLTYSQIYF